MISEVTRQRGRLVASRCDLTSAVEFEALSDDYVHLPSVKVCINSLLHPQVKQPILYNWLDFDN